MESPRVNFAYSVKENFLLAYPVMLSQLGHVLVQVADTLMIGNFLGAVPLAAASLANSGIIGLMIIFGLGVSFAITPLVARADGEHDASTITEVLRHGFLVNILTGLVLFSAIVFIGRHIGNLQQPEQVSTLAVPYMDIVAFSIIPLMVFQTFRQFAEGLSRTRVSMLIVIGSNVLNIILNYVFLTGAFGILPMGLPGVGWATLISRVAMAAGMGLYIYYGKRFREHRRGFAFDGYSRHLMRKLLNVGLPAGLQFLLEGAAFGVSTIMMGWISTRALAAHQIALNLATLSYMVTSGLAAAATIKVGKHLGRRDPVSLRHDANTLIVMAITLMSFWAVLFITGRTFLASLYINDAAIVALAAPFIVVAGFFQLFDGAQVVCAGALRGLQDVKIPTLFVFAAYWIIALPLGYGLSFHTRLGPTGIWVALLAGLTVAALTMFIRFRHLSRSRALS